MFGIPGFAITYGKEIAEVGPLVIASLAFLVSLYTILRDRSSRQHDMLHRAIVHISSLNMKIADTAGSSTKKVNNKSQIKMLTNEYINQYNYLAFLINKGQIKDQHAYDLDSKFFFRFFDKFSSNKMINENDHKPVFKLVKRWEKYPPNTFRNRITSKIRG